jgi:Ca2+-binding EF-hand superfamily protein
MCMSQQHFAQAWKAADKDGDGFISREEFSEMPRVRNLPEEKLQRLFERLDKDGDGRLGRDELRRMGRSPDGPRPAMRRLWELDADRSGGVSLEEFKAGELFRKLPPERQLEIFRRLDTDGDGLITPKDRPEPPFKRDEARPREKRGPGPDRRMPNPADSRAMIRELDQDGDGALSFEEFRAGPAVRDLSEDEQEDRFEALDRDGDQKITAADFPQRGPHGGPKQGERPRPAR